MRIQPPTAGKILLVAALLGLGSGTASGLQAQRVTDMSAPRGGDTAWARGLQDGTLAARLTPPPDRVFGAASGLGLVFGSVAALLYSVDETDGPTLARNFAVPVGISLVGRTAAALRARPSSVDRLRRERLVRQPALRAPTGGVIA